MPELPTVEHLRKILQSNIIGKTIKTVKCPQTSNVLQPNEKSFQNLKERTVKSIHRRGKTLWILFSEKPKDTDKTLFNLLLHLGMTGYIHLYQPGDDEPKYQKLIITFTDGSFLAYCNMRGFGRAIMCPSDIEKVSRIKNLGPDAFESFPEPEEFHQLLLTKVLKIKPLLMDQKYVSGLGNWLVDDILYKSKIHPEKKSNTVSLAQAKIIRDATISICKTAIDCLEKGKSFPSEWIYHKRERSGAARKKRKRDEDNENSTKSSESPSKASLSPAKRKKKNSVEKYSKLTSSSTKQVQDDDNDEEDESTPTKTSFTMIRVNSRATYFDPKVQKKT